MENSPYWMDFAVSVFVVGKRASLIAIEAQLLAKMQVALFFILANY